MSLHDASECPATGKRRWGTRPKAVTELRLIQGRSRRGCVPQRVYFCKMCNGWHLTHEAKHRKLKDLEND